MTTIYINLDILIDKKIIKNPLTRRGYFQMRLNLKLGSVARVRSYQKNYDQLLFLNRLKRYRKNGAKIIFLSKYYESTSIEILSNFDYDDIYYYTNNKNKIDFILDNCKTKAVLIDTNPLNMINTRLNTINIFTIHMNRGQVNLNKLEKLSKIMIFNDTYDA